MVKGKALFSSSERRQMPPVGRREFKPQVLVCRQVKGRIKRRRSSQIGRRGTEALTHQPYRAADQVLVRDLTDPNGTIHPFLHQIHNALIATDLQVYLWELLGEIGQ